MQIYIEILIAALLFVLIFECFHSNKNNAQKPKQKEEKEKIKEQKTSSIMGETKHIPKVKKTVQNPKPVEEKQPSKKSVVPTEELDEVFSSSNNNVNPEEWELSDEEEELQALRSFNNDDDFATGLSYEDLQKIPQMMNDDKVTQDNITLAVKLLGTELLESLNEQMPQASKCHKHKSE